MKVRLGLFFSCRSWVRSIIFGKRAEMERLWRAGIPATQRARLLGLSPTTERRWRKGLERALAAEKSDAAGTSLEETAECSEALPGSDDAAAALPRRPGETPTRGAAEPSWLFLGLAVLVTLSVLVITGIRWLKSSKPSLLPARGYSQPRGVFGSSRVRLLEENAARLRARSLSQSATLNFHVGAYREALTNYEEANLLKEDPAFTFDIAQCLRLLGEPEAAARAYRAYRQAVPDAGNSVAKFIADADAAVAARAMETSTGSRRQGAVMGTPKKSGSKEIAAALPIQSPERKAEPKPEPKAEQKPETKATSPRPIVLVKAQDPNATASQRLKPIQELIEAHRAGFRACYDAWSAQHRNIPGKVTLSFYLDPDGVLNQASAQPIGFDAADVAACIVNFAKTLTYPPAPNAKYTRFNYRFDFKPN